MEKINIAELLRNCPKGMELDCLLFKDAPVYFNRITNSCHYPIEIKVEYPDGSFEKFELSKEGCIYDRIIAKCVIFPKGKTTWERFVPPCQFKVGDIIYNRLQKKICIYFLYEDEVPRIRYCRYNESNIQLQFEKLEYPIPIAVQDYRLATEEEKQKLFDAIKANGYKWNEETKTLEKLPKFKVGDKITKIDGSRKGEIYYIDIDKYHVAVSNNIGIDVFFEDQDDWELVPDKFDITTLKPFQKVLVRDSDEEYWSINLFGFYNEITKQYCCMGNTDIGWDECIPYEGNEHLLGTTNDCDEFYKNWK